MALVGSWFSAGPRSWNRWLMGRLSVGNVSPRFLARKKSRRGIETDPHGNYDARVLEANDDCTLGVASRRVVSVKEDRNASMHPHHLTNYPRYTSLQIFSRPGINDLRICKYARAHSSHV